MITANRYTEAVLFTLRQAVKVIQREMDEDPPFSAANAERRGELDQLRDMIDRRT